MNLPNISTPTYEVKLFSQDKPVKFRPFLVKEQKLMLMAAEAKTSEDTANIVKQIAQNCLIDNINVDELPLVDLELLFLNFRARSIGENIITYFKCKNKNSSQEECGMVIELPINLLEVPVVNADVQKKIMITDNVGVQMKYPTFEAVTLLSSEKFNDDPDAEFKAAAMNIDYVFDEMNFNRIQLKAATGNFKSQRVAKRLGFREEGIERESELHQRGFVDLIVYSLLKAER